MNRRIRALGLISAAAALTGGALAALRREGDVPPVNHLGGKAEPLIRSGFEIFTTVLGDRGSDVVLVHGVHAGASSYEFRRLAPLLAVDHRVVAFDFLGCGLSDHPSISYSPDLFVDQIIDVIGARTTAPVTLIGSSYGAAYALAAAGRAPDRVKAVVALSPSGIEDEPPHSILGRKITEAVFRSPVLGESLYAALTADPSVASFLRRVYADDRSITPELLAHFRSVNATKGARHVVAAFIARELGCDLSGELPFLQTPVLVIDGDSGRLGARDGELAARVLPNARRVVLARTGLLPHEERPQQTAEAINAFLGEHLPVSS